MSNKKFYYDAQRDTYIFGERGATEGTKVQVNKNNPSLYIGDVELPEPKIEEKIWDYLSKLRNMSANVIESREAIIVPYVYITDAVNLTITFKRFGGFSLQACITSNFFKKKIVNNFMVSVDGKEGFRSLPIQYSERLKNIILITLEKAYNEKTGKGNFEDVEKKLCELEAYLEEK